MSTPIWALNSLPLWKEQYVKPYNNRKTIVARPATYGSHSVSRWLRIHANDDALTSMEIKNEKFVLTKTLILKLRALILPIILPKSGTWQWVAQQLVIFYAAKKSGCHENSGRAAKYGKLEEALMLWFNDIRSRGAPVKDAMLVLWIKHNFSASRWILQISAIHVVGLPDSWPDMVHLSCTRHYLHHI